MTEVSKSDIPPPPGPLQGQSATSVWVVPAMTFIIGALMVGIVALLLSGDDGGIAAGSEGYEVLYEPPGDVGPAAFFSIADRVEFSGSTTSTSGATPLPSEIGLYGGSLEQTCIPEVVVAYLMSEPDKAAAWAGVHGIAVDQIPDFVMSLTPAILQVDTRVTNHGYSGGIATPRQSILPAFTAVLVDQDGRPRVRCYCGNPLRDPRDPGTPCTCPSTTTTTSLVLRTTTTTSSTTTTTTTRPSTTTTQGVGTTTTSTPIFVPRTTTTIKLN